MKAADKNTKISVLIKPKSSVSQPEKDVKCSRNIITTAEYKLIGLFFKNNFIMLYNIRNTIVENIKTPAKTENGISKTLLDV